MILLAWPKKPGQYGVEMQGCPPQHWPALHSTQGPPSKKLPGISCFPSNPCPAPWCQDCPVQEGESGETGVALE